MRWRGSARPALTWLGPPARFDRVTPGSPIVLGIVNVTPDSFSDGGRYVDAELAIAHGHQLLADGADQLDIGGESTRPGSDPVDVDTELARVLPVVEALAPHAVVSIDTSKPEVARAAVAAGAGVINDVSAKLGLLAAELGVGWIAMHSRGEPKTMQIDPHYDDVVREVRDALVAVATEAVAAGAPRVWIDPGIGFGKTTDHNLALLANLHELVATEFPVAVGLSRKRFVGELHGRADGAPGVVTAVDDRLEGSLAGAVWAAAQGVSLVRVHDVRETVHAVRVVTAEVEGG